MLKVIPQEGRARSLCLVVGSPPRNGGPDSLLRASAVQPGLPKPLPLPLPTPSFWPGLRQPLGSNLHPQLRWAPGRGLTVNPLGKNPSDKAPPWLSSLQCLSPRRSIRMHVHVGGLRSRSPRLETCLALLASWSWARSLTPLSFYFFICKMGTTKSHFSSPGGWVRHVCWYTSSIWKSTRWNQRTECIHYCYYYYYYCKVKILGYFCQLPTRKRNLGCPANYDTLNVVDSKWPLKKETIICFWLSI